MYKITLNDGTILNNLSLNGNNFISDSLIGNETFENNLESVTIFDGENSVLHSNMKLIQNNVIGNKTWFIITDKTNEEKSTEQLESSLTDIQMALADLYESVTKGTTNG